MDENDEAEKDSMKHVVHLLKKESAGKEKERKEKKRGGVEQELKEGKPKKAKPNGAKGKHRVYESECLPFL